MDYFELIKNRHSVRSYKDDPVEENKLKQILEAARLAPTACNRQAFKIVVMRTKDHADELHRIYPMRFFTQAPIVLGIFTKPDETWMRSDGINYGEVDAAIVMDHIILAATALGLGTCWIGAFDPDVARQVIGLDNGYEPVAFTPVGYAKSSNFTKNRKGLEEIVVYI